MKIGNKANRTQAKSPRPKPKSKAHKTSRTRQPEGLTLEEWQIALRRQDAREQPFRLRKLGKEAVFSEFAVRNAQSGGTYRVLVRGANPGDNSCSCPDFAINTLGTCKHIEYILLRLEKNRRHRTILAQGHLPRHSEIYLRHGLRREIVFNRVGIARRRSSARPPAASTIETSGN